MLKDFGHHYEKKKKKACLGLGCLLQFILEVLNFALHLEYLTAIQCLHGIAVAMDVSCLHPSVFFFFFEICIRVSDCTAKVTP